ncbi:hypothetical protein MASR1M74_30040 [Lentimicrobium sp.]
MKIKISKQNHRDESRLKLEFNYNQALIALVKQIEGAKWSKTMKAWHMPDTEDAFRQLKILLADHELLLAGQPETENGLDIRYIQEIP